MRRTAILAAAAAALGLAGVGCAGAGASGTGSAGTIGAVAAENEYASVLSQVGGRYVHVSAILQNPSTDPHTFEASPQIAAEVSGAQLIVQNGVGYDSWMSKIEAASPSSSRKVITAQHVLGLPDTTPNPHLWYDPKTMPAVARVMAADLSAIQPRHKAYFQARLKAFDHALAPWLDAITQFKARHPGATAATTEPVADYLLTAMGITNLTPFAFQADIMNGTDPSPQDISHQNGLFSQHKAMFFAYNQQVVTPLTTEFQKSARRAGIPIVGVYETMPPGYSYQGWMLAEVRAITRAVTSKTSTQTLG
jgi:zinc/manganese transport system substrate-binding protein